ncbi:peptidase S8/S53 domain-containing protein [Crucibulum laeve]|uniref:Peptidase S8/S53 domain-containing protein n=1 Tax=Crucibulum laeve TaxID=68775 RepID=A0A5C3LQY2_9AGAR|nr:peptidase S8/S53 domain-containing protein [Crucibulum laeve]
MRFFWTAAAALFAHCSLVGASTAKRSYDTRDYYVVEHSPLVNAGAPLDDVATALGLKLEGKVGELDNHYLLSAPKSVHGLHSRSEHSDRVLEAFESLKARASSRLVSRSEGALHARSIVSSRAPPPIRRPLSSESSRAISERLGIQDPMFSKQWHLVNDDYPEHMMNVAPVWDMGYTGKGVITSFLDDGLDYTSEDLADNFDAANSYDFNDHVPLPMPKKATDHHGTRCAGQVAAGKNAACGIGIAYNSKVAGVRILSGKLTDADETAALNYGYQNVSIYSCSWGPRDNGKTMEGPNYLIKKGLVNGINKGRGGKGSIFVFASGNGGGHGDQCNFDGYTNSIYSVTVSSLDYKGRHPYYSEACAANMVVAYSSGAGRHIVTTDIGKNQCATNHGGTSAAAPNVAGVFALALEARPDLTWRDIQYLSIETARMVNPDDPDWERIANNRLYSYKYGFGAIDAEKYVTAAKEWKLVKPQAWIESKTIQLNNGTYKDKTYSGGEYIGPKGVQSKMMITKEMLAENNFATLEHINVKVWIDHSRRGDVEVEIISPTGIRSVLAGKREKDEAETGFPGWKFMSVKHWGDSPVGEWTIRVYDQGEPAEEGYFLGWNMILWGTTIDSSKAKQYEVPLIEDVLPPMEAPSSLVVPAPTVTKEHGKPTDHLPSDHGTAEGENTKPAFSSRPTSPLPGQTWPAFTSDGFFNLKLLSFAIAAAVLSGVVAGVYFWRRQRRLASYTSLSAVEDVSMGSVAHGGMVSRAPGADEGRVSPPGRSTMGLGFHSGFLDDDEPSTAGSDRTPTYRDIPV